MVFVKGFYDRPLDGRPGEGGRVTELVARPADLGPVPPPGALAQPLAGEYAARREVFEQVPFVDGYGVDLGLVIDVAERCGVAALAQCDLGERIHRNRPLSELGPQALAVVQVALSRAGPGARRAHCPRAPWQSRLVRPGARRSRLPSQRPPLARWPRPAAPAQVRLRPVSRPGQELGDHLADAAQRRRPSPAAAPKRSTRETTRRRELAHPLPVDVARHHHDRHAELPGQAPPRRRPPCRGTTARRATPRP